ncbi:MAG: hypothetical protein RIE73_08950 [Coleofasciculus sp. C1-SOL-03]
MSLTCNLEMEYGEDEEVNSKFYLTCSLFPVPCSLFPVPYSLTNDNYF